MNAPTPDVKCTVLMTRLNLDALIRDHMTPFEIENAGEVRGIVDSVFDPVVYTTNGIRLYEQILNTCRFLAMNNTTYETELYIGPERPKFFVRLSIHDRIIEEEVLRDPLAM